MTELFSRFLNTSVSASFLILGVILLRFLFRKTAPKWAICLLWVVVAVRLILPFTLPSPFGLVPERASNVSAVFDEPSSPLSAEPSFSELPDADTEPIASPASLPTYSAAAPGISQTKPSPDPSIGSAVASQDVPDLSTEAGVIPTEPVSNDQRSTRVSVLFVFSVIWMTGAAALLLYALVHGILLRKKLALSVPYEPGVRQSERVRSPFVFGLLRPTVYLPFGLGKQAESFVLAHERAHISRGDHWLKYGWFAVLALHWFNPLVWLSFVLLCRDIEYACDERVVRNMPDEDRKAYAETLLKLGTGSRTLATFPIAFGETDVKRRIRRVFRSRKPAVWMVVLFLLSSVLLTACFSTVSVSPVPGDESKNISAGEPPEDIHSSSDDPSGSSHGEPSQNPDDTSADGQPKTTREYRLVSYTDLNTDVTETYSYDAYGQLVKTIRSDGSETTYTYTDDGHPLTEIHTRGGQTVMSVTWVYDQDGRLTEKKDSFGSIRYEYDENGRLTKQIQSGLEQTYAYDEVGNYAVTTVLGDGKTHVVHFNITGKPVRTTVDGRVTNEYDYDEFGDLIELRSYDDSGKVFEYIRYHYAVDGSLIKKEISTEPGEVHYLRYDRTQVGESTDIEYRITYVSKDGKETPFGAGRLSPMIFQKDETRFDNRAQLPPEQNRLVGAFETGTMDRSLEELKKEYPHYFGLDPANGLTVYVFAVAPEAYWCAALAETDDKEVKLETLDSDHLVSVEEMKRILESYAVPDSSVKIVPGYAAVSSYKYSLQDIADSISALFDHRYEIELPPKTAE